MSNAVVVHGFIVVIFDIFGIVKEFLYKIGLRLLREVFRVLSKVKTICAKIMKNIGWSIFDVGTGYSAYCLKVNFYTHIVANA